MIPDSFHLKMIKLQFFNLKLIILKEFVIIWIFQYFIFLFSLSVFVA